MHLAFLNLHGNFDPQDRYLTAHPDFGGQLVYVKEVALALGRMGHRVDIVTRRIEDPRWPGFEARLDGYPGEPNVRIVRLECGGPRFRRKQELWPFIGTQWVPAIEAFYGGEGVQPEAVTAHYGDAGLAASLWQAGGGPRYTFTAHSLGAQKLDRLLADNHIALEDLEPEFHFARRIAAERVAMEGTARVITSTRQERIEQYSHPAYGGAVDPADDARFALVAPGVSLEVFDADRSGPADAAVAEHVEAVIERDIAPQRRHLPAVICSSRLEVKKNHAGLIRAFGESEELRATANLLMVVRGAEGLRGGSALKPDERAQLERLAELVDDYGLEGAVSVFSLEGQAELAGAYRHLARRQSIFALTALYEPFGLAPLEAMAAGLPAIATARGGPSETLRDAGDGAEYAVLLDPTDPADIASGALRLLRSDETWALFRDRGRRRVLDHFTWERAAEGYRAVLERISGGDGVERSGLEIPRYFIDPRPEHDFDVDELRRLYGRSI